MTGGARVWVLGGGVAGLRAALGLAERGFAVRLLESRAWLGGRAFSSPDRVSGQQLDNGPHVLLGCYRETRWLLRRLGTEAGLQQDRRLALAYRGTGGRLLRLRLGPLPVPLALPWALLRLAVPLGVRLRSLRGLLASLRPAPAHWTMADWLDRRRQRGVPDDLLWRPLCRAIMNSEPEHVAAEAMLRTLREAFGGSAANAALWVPRRPWSELLGDPAAAALAAAGVTLRLGARVGALHCTAGRVEAIGLTSGERIELGAGERVVAALPWFAMRTLLPGNPALASAGGLRSSPIVSAYVACAPDRAPVPDDGPVTVLVGGAPFHFLLRTPGGDARRFALLSGGDRSFDGQPVERIAARALDQLRRHLPAEHGAALDGAQVTVRKEQHATFVAACGSDGVRPAPGRLPGGPDNLYVCGDWTATGLPATLEGAARSAARTVAMVAAGPAPAANPPHAD